MACVIKDMNFFCSFVLKIIKLSSNYPKNGKIS